MRKVIAVFIFVISLATTGVFAQTDPVKRTKELVAEIVARSYPELAEKPIDIETFKSRSDFFRARVDLGPILMFRKMRYIVLVNPRVYQEGAPPDAIKAILAHEIAHILYYAKRNRFELIGLARLAGRDFTRDFERRADLVAISRGYAGGLIEYRKWLYQHIPAAKLEEKKRNYFSPEEIELILEILREKPEMLEKWQKNVPRTKDDLLS